MFGFLKRNEGLKDGDRAPGFRLPDSEGRDVDFEDVLRRSDVVLYFYPKDGTRVCTAESVAFRDRYAEFQSLGADILGVSSDSIDSHHRFKENNRLPFTLLSDARGRVRRLYRVPRTLGVVPGRTTYVIGRDGVVRQRFSSLLDADSHVALSLEKIRALSSDRKTPDSPTGTASK